jgi:hypothetical protein
MGHDPIARRPLRAVDRPHPAMSNMAVGELAQVERLAGAVLLGDGDAPMVAVDRDDLGGIAVVAGSGAVVTGELEAVAGAELGLLVLSRDGRAKSVERLPPSNLHIFGNLS